MIAPHNAKLWATISFSNFGHKIPGVSSNSRELLILIQVWLFVTPGLSPVTAAFLLASVLINVDLPTLGIPITNALILKFE